VCLASFPFAARGAKLPLFLVEVLLLVNLQNDIDFSSPCPFFFFSSGVEDMAGFPPPSVVVD